MQCSLYISAVFADLLTGGANRCCIIDSDIIPGGRENMRFSGDLVKKVSDITIYFVGRKDDMVKRHGKRFHLQEVEMVI